MEDQITKMRFLCKVAQEPSLNMYNKFMQRILFVSQLYCFFPELRYFINNERSPETLRIK